MLLKSCAGKLYFMERCIRLFSICSGDGIGIHEGLKIPCCNGVRVRISPGAFINLFRRYSYMLKFTVGLIGIAVIGITCGLALHYMSKSQDAIFRGMR